ncbi:Hepatic leukemia factor [Anabarilius grahami]|uniref:Hepatic leukemia factor n=1 Tax=Anabarilius grahami TaxID=495550 RepID=A0A3N0XTA2_ANAGA|nr:Hepatic leukemia factor [Anabarilius grahami]
MGGGRGGRPRPQALSLARALFSSLACSLTSRTSVFAHGIANQLRFCAPASRPHGRARTAAAHRKIVLSNYEMEKMSRPLPINPTFLPPTHGVLKSLLENPMKLPFHHDEGFGKEKEKEKKLEEDGNGLNTPQSAFLGPTLWDKTLPYDGDNFQLEYMDLEEFLLENNIPANSQSEQNQPSQQPLPQQPPSGPPTPSVVDLSNRATTSVHSGIVGQNCIQSPSRAVCVLKEVKARVHRTVTVTPDDKYWARRRKNNVAAKRSRDARRLKENQIAIRAGFLEKENAALRQEVADLRKELGRCKNVLAKYEARHGPLPKNPTAYFTHSQTQNSDASKALVRLERPAGVDGKVGPGNRRIEGNTCRQSYERDVKAGDV